MSETRRYVCPRCGMVRDADRAPWCRHGDFMLPASRMKLISASHPWAPGRCRIEDEMWLLERPS